MKKNCLNCNHLSYEEDQDSDGHIIGGGYSCEKRIEKEYEKGAEEKLWANLSRKAYLEKGKSCCDIK
jgi:hypothetical protein